jgi:transposase
MEQSNEEFREIEKKIHELFCKLNVVDPITDKHPKQDKSIPHSQREISTVYCVVSFCLRRYIPNEFILF